MNLFAALVLVGVDVMVMSSVWVLWVGGKSAV